MTDLHSMDSGINVNRDMRKTFTKTCTCVTDCFWLIFRMKFVNDNPSEKSVAFSPGSVATQNRQGGNM